jgi:hypothetical protein
MNDQTRTFLIATNMSIAARIGLIVALVVAGFAIQLFAPTPIGWPFMILASLFAAAKGLSNTPNITGEPTWQNVTLDEFNRAGELLEKASGEGKRLNRYSLKSFVGCAGCAGFVVMLLLVCAALMAAVDGNVNEDGFFIPILGGGSVSALVFLNALALAAPVWLLGTVKPWEPPSFRMRFDQLSYIYKMFAVDADLTFTPALRIAKTKTGSTPLECKMMSNFKHAPAEFMGIQVQTSLNTVQGTDYPYTYAVLVAKLEFGLKGKAQALVETPPRGGFRTRWGATDNEKKEAKYAQYKDALVEIKKEGDVDIVVIRQNTSGNGYRTSPDEAAAVFNKALDLSKTLLG